MNDQQTDVNPTAEEDVSLTPTSSVEPKATEEVETESTEPEIKTEDVEETKTETEEVPKKGAESRIRELNAKAKSAEEKAKSLEQQLAELTAPVGVQVPKTPYIPPVEPGQEINQEQYKQHVLQTAGTMVDLRIRQSEAINRINNEAGQAIRKYPQLDPDNESFDKELSEAVTEATINNVRANPYTASPKQIVDRMMKPYLRSVTKEVANQTENIAKQVSGQALRPTSISKGEKSAKDMSTEELEKKLGVVQG
jgi:hypothetical protein